jgi:hypothetical protein
MRSLERVQGRLQAVLLLGAGAWYAASHSTVGSFVGLALVALIYQVVALVWGARTSRHKATMAPAAK